MVFTPVKSNHISEIKLICCCASVDMPRADRCKRKEEELQKAAIKVEKIPSLFAFQKHASSCNEETSNQRSTQVTKTDLFEFQEGDRGQSKSGASQENPSFSERTE